MTHGSQEVLQKDDKRESKGDVGELNEVNVRCIIRGGTVIREGES